MTLPSWCSRSWPSSVGSSTCRSRASSSSTSGSSRCSEGVPEVHPDSLRRRASGWTCSRRDRAVGIGLAYTLYRRGLEDPERDPLIEKLGPLAPVFGHAYYYDAAIVAARRRSGPARSPAGSTGSSTTRSSTARSTASAAVRAASARGIRGADRSRAPVRARHHLGVVARLLYVVLWRGGRAGATSRSSPLILITPIVGALICMLLARAAVRSTVTAVAYATMAATLGFAALAALGVRRRRRHFQFVENQRWFPASASATSSASTASASSWSCITALLFPIGLLASAKHRAPGQGVHVWFLLLEGAIMGIFLSLDLIASSCSGSDARPDVLPHRGLGQRAARVRGDEVLHLHRGRLGVPARVDPGRSRSCTRPTPASLTFDYRVLAEWNGLARAPPSCAVPRAS